jgi:two-component system sensor kinase FixL
LKESAIGEVLRKGEAAFIPDLDSAEHFLRKDEARQANLRSYLAVPVLIHKQVAVILEFFHTESTKPHDSVLEVMDVIAAYLGHIIEQKRTEKKLQALFDSAPDAQIVTDTLGKILMANRQTSKVLGYAEDALIGQPVEMLLPPEHRSEHIEHRARYVDTARARPMGIGMELTALCKDGTAIPVEVSLSPIELEEGLLITAAIRDVRERKKLEAQLSEKERLAEMGKMAAIFAHEVANPLQGISTISQLLKESVPADYLGLMNDLETEVAHLESLLNQFRSFSKLSDLNVSSVDLTRLVDRVVRIYRAHWSGLGIRVVTEFARNLSLEADAARLHQVMVNLSRNAVESMSNGGTLTLRTYGTDQDVLLEVGDTGPGVAEGTGVFELFKTTKAQGTGIGLYVVQQIVSAHGGTVTYSTKQGIGATFRISLPRKKNSETEASNPR